MAVPFEVEQRRKQIVDLLMRGTSKTVIMKVLSIAPATFYRDLNAIYEEFGGKLDDFDPTEFVSKMMAFNEYAKSEAIDQYYSAPIGSSSKAQFLSVALAANDRNVKLLQDMGLLEKIPEKLEIKGRLKYEKFSDEELDDEIAKVKARIATLRRLQLTGTVGKGESSQD